MGQEIEIEFKNMITENEYNRLIENFSTSNDQVVTQKNYYFDTPSFSLRQQQSALRIRYKKGNYTLTLKQPHTTGKLETNQDISPEQAERMLQDDKFISGEVKDILIQVNIDVDELKNLGALTTHRFEIPYKSGLLVLDHSQYLGTDDYEIEFEVPNEEQGKIEFEALLNQYQIPVRKTDNKIKRFFQRKERNSSH